MNKLKTLFLSILIGSFAGAIASFAFSSPGSNQPPNGNPIFWLLSGTSMYYTAGNVGIGTNSPVTSLYIHAATNQNLGIGGAVGSPGSVALSALNDANSLNVPMEFRASQYYFYGGNVGIGTNSPLAQFTLGNIVNQTNLLTYTSVNQAHLQYYAAQNFPATNNYQRVLDIVSGGDGGNSAGSNIRFLTAPGSSSTAVTRLIIDPNGNVGIGTTSPVSALSVNGNAVFTGTVDIGFEVVGGVCGAGVCPRTCPSGKRAISGAFDITGDYIGYAKITAYDTFTCYWKNATAQTFSCWAYCARVL